MSSIEHGVSWQYEFHVLWEKLIYGTGTYTVKGSREIGLEDVGVVAMLVKMHCVNGGRRAPMSYDEPLRRHRE